jgi:hypothetical protein
MPTIHRFSEYDTRVPSRTPFMLNTLTLLGKSCETKMRSSEDTANPYGK